MRPDPLAEEAQMAALGQMRGAGQQARSPRISPELREELLALLGMSDPANEPPPPMPPPEGEEPMPEEEDEIPGVM